MSKKTSSTAQQVKAAQNADKRHPWPDEAGLASETDLVMFTKLQCQRSHDDWTDSDLISLANLARLQTDLVAEHSHLRSEGHIIFGGKTGLTKFQNPRARVVHDLNSSINSLARRLGLTAMSVAEKRSAANRGQQERAARRKTDRVPAKDGLDRSSLM
ncbi:hypothetical protein [Shimia thalassica]|uniref:hypothetical protein n=1 Tax=Shimia thalassica TaxID=1715693 RepID=UPI002736FACC|nr:hypothetical protein [Shimia thalassica]MDP2520271.1 hypothetical protein [Shimia thalassica]